MPRSVVLVALILMLMTGLVLGQMSSLGQKMVQISATSDSGTAETARAFYRAINQYLQTGDAEHVEQLLAPGFVGHAPYLTGEESAVAFLQYLESMRSAFPGLRVEVSDLLAQAGAVVVDVTVTGDTNGTFYGLLLDAGAGVSGYEVLRVEGQQIAERWGSREMPPLVRPVFAADLPIVADTILEPRVERLAWEPNGTLELVDYDGFLLMAESRGLTYEVVSHPDPAVTWTSPFTFSTGAGPVSEKRMIVELAPGDAVAFPAGMRLRMLNTGSEPASALTVSVRPVQFAMGGGLPYKVLESTGVERSLLTGGGGVLARPENSPRSIAVGNIVLPPGSVIPRHATGDAELLVVIDGQIDVAVDEGAVVWSQPAKSFTVIYDLQTVEAGEAVRANSGAVVDYRAGRQQPAALWVVTISSDAATTPADPADRS
jgi:predicted ester cyclase/quercetin dioxygenase-like cupin family protein